MIRRSIVFLADLIYVLILIGLFVGAIYSVLDFLDSLLRISAPLKIPRVPVIGTAILGTIFLAEAFLPLRSVEVESVLYKPNSLRVGWGIGLVGFAQLAFFGIVPFLLLEKEKALLFSLFGVLLRLLLGWKKWRLSVLVGAGRKTSAITAAWFVQDSELISKAIAQTQLRNCKFPQGRGLNKLVVRRVLRRSYLLPIFVITAIWSLAVSFTSVSGAILLLFVVHSIALAGVLRCSVFEEFFPSTMKRTFLVALPFLLVSGIIFSFLTHAHFNFLSQMIYLFALWKTAASRAKPRSAEGEDFVETGLGAFSIGLLDYYVKGFSIGSLLLFISLFVAK